VTQKGAVSERPFKPSQVTPCDRWKPKPACFFMPFVGGMRKAEAEMMAACIVRVCEVRGDMWLPVAWKDVQDVLRADVLAERKPWVDWLSNPFLRPDVWELVERGFAAWADQEGGAVVFTEEGFAVLAEFVRS
jgi:hypothetical protein